MKDPKPQSEDTWNQEKEEYDTVLSSDDALARLAQSYPKLAPTAELRHDGVLHWVAEFNRPTGMRITVYIPDSKIDTRVVSVFRSRFSIDARQERAGGYDMWLWVCEDCNTYYLTGELPEDRDREVEVVTGEIIHGPLRPFYSAVEGYREDSKLPCDACGDKSQGERYRFHPSIEEE